MLNVGIVGLGHMGRVHARHYRNIPDARLTAAYDLRPERTEQFVSEFGGKFASSFRELLENCDAVDVCTPTPTHAEISIQALEAGKHVLCEKPMCLDVRDCRNVLEAVERSGRVFMPAHVVRFFPEFKMARKLVLEGAVGTPAAIRTHRGGPFPRPPGHWFADFAKSGGVLLDLAVHDFDWIRWTFGEVDRVFAKGLVDKGIPRCDYALTLLHLRSGAVAHVESSWAHPGGFRVRFEIAGDGGFLEYDSWAQPTVQAWKSSENKPASTERESPLLPHDDPYFLELSHFVNCALEGQRPEITAEDGLKAVELCHAALQSVRTGRPVDVEVR